MFAIEVYPSEEVKAIGLKADFDRNVPAPARAAGKNVKGHVRPVDWLMFPLRRHSGSERGGDAPGRGALV